QSSCSASHPPPIPSTHHMALRPSSVPQRVPLPSPLVSSLTDGPDPALVTELVDFATVSRLDYTTALVAESGSACPPSVEGECAIGTNVLEDRVKQPPGSPPASKARYVARGFSQRQGVDFFLVTTSSTPRTSAHLFCRAASTRRSGFTGSFPAGAQWSLRRTVYGLRQAPREWHDTPRTTLVAFGFAPLPANPSLFLCIDTSLPPFYVLLYVYDLLFATADTEALALILQRFGFRYSSPQSTPLPTGHSLSAPPLDESVEPSGLYPELVGCLMHLMTCTQPDLAYPLSILARYVAPGRHRPDHWEAAKRVLRYLCSTSGMRLVLGERRPVVLTGHADASWGHGCTGAGLTDLPTDRPGRVASFFSCSQRGPLHLDYVATRANTADIFTKALQSSDHQRFCTVLGLLALLFLIGLELVFRCFQFIEEGIPKLRYGGAHYRREIHALMCEASEGTLLESLKLKGADIPPLSEQQQEDEGESDDVVEVDLETKVKDLSAEQAVQAAQINSLSEDMDELKDLLAAHAGFKLPMAALEGLNRPESGDSTVVVVAPGTTRGALHTSAAAPSLAHRPLFGQIPGFVQAQGDTSGTQRSRAGDTGPAAGASSSAADQAGAAACVTTAPVGQPGAFVRAPPDGAGQPGAYAGAPPAGAVQPGSFASALPVGARLPGAAAGVSPAAVAQPGAAVVIPTVAVGHPGAKAVVSTAAVGQPDAAAVIPIAAVGQPKAAAGVPTAAAGQPGSAGVALTAAAAQPCATAGAPKAAAGQHGPATGVAINAGVVRSGDDCWDILGPGLDLTNFPPCVLVQDATGSQAANDAPRTTVLHTSSPAWTSREQLFVPSGFPLGFSRGFVHQERGCLLHRQVVFSRGHLHMLR
ncbi:unnamed protein product, partial [Closterium sp. NIES-53]